jgi:sensor histidine kinase regulating citrate/malate metabolism
MTMTPLLLITVVAFLVSNSLSYVITKGSSHLISKSQQYQNEKVKINCGTTSNPISQSNSSSLFELDVCDYGKYK